MRHRNTKGRVVAIVVSALVAGLGLAACGSKTTGPGGAVTAFVAGWRSGSFPASLTFVDAAGAPVPNADVSSQLKALSGDLSAMTPTLVAGPATVTKDTATATLSVSWPITVAKPWTYQSTVRLSHKDKIWRVIWEPQVVEPHLKAAGHLEIDSVPSKRGSILDGSGKPLVTDTPVVYVGIEPMNVTDITSLVSALSAAFTSANLSIDLSDLPAEVKAAQPTAFVPVVTLRQDVYTTIKPQIHDLNGTVFRQGTQQLAPTKVFAHALLGEVDDVTKEQMDASPGKYQIGDQVGNGGIEGQYDDRLRGTPGRSVVIPGVGTAADGTANPPTVLFTVPAVDGQSVTTSLDVNTQNAADNALANEALPATIVAMRISDGAIIAIANGPGATGNDLGLNAQVPPGSTFKTVTATNLLESGAETPSSVVACPKQLNVGGRVFGNAEGEVLGATTLLIDFAKSCNTAFASLYPKLGTNGLTGTAAQLGLGGAWTVGLPTFTGSVPPGGSNIDQAAAAFGQGKTLVSPVSMMSMVGAVARGHWFAPTVVSSPAPTNPAPGAPLKQTTVDALKTMMRAVITSGTGHGLLAVPGDPVYGKTGTAEYDDNPAHTHSWFTGYQGDIALAVFVQGGGLSTAKAVPLAAKFLTYLH